MMRTLPLLTAILFSIAPTLAAQRTGGGMDKSLSWYGDTSGDRFGDNVTGLDDYDGDGIIEIAVGAPGYDLGSIANAGLLRVYSGATGALVYEYTGSADYDNFGGDCALVGDVDGDGIADFAFSSSGRNEIYLHSGANGSLIRTLSAPAGVQTFGRSLAGPGDVNGDGLVDLIIGASDSDLASFTNNGAVLIYTASTGVEIRRYEGSEDFAYLGNSVAAPGDVDGDGYPDVLSGALWTNPNGLSRAGSAYLWSGFDGSLIYQWDGEKDNQRFGEFVGAAGDADDDGRPDLAVGAPADYNGNGLWQGSVSVYSGATGQLLWNYFGSEDLESVGDSMDVLGDFNRDGHDDLLVGAAGRAWGGRVYLLSGADGALLYRFESEGWSHEFGCDVAGIGDIDQDGELEALIGACAAWNFGPTPGGAYLYTFSPFLSASSNQISASAGGSITFDIDFADDDINAPIYYILLASGSGVGPSTLQGWQLPLTADGLYATTLAGNHPPQLSNASAQLDSNGDGTAVLSFAPGEANAFVGNTYFLSAVKYEDAPWMSPNVMGVSLVESFTIVP